MPYRVLADVVAVAHFAFIAYVVAGGFLAWRYPRTLIAHVLAVCWGFGTVLIGFVCPLTELENWARVRAGVAPLPPPGFIDHYLTGVLYPADAIGLVQLLTALTIAASWIGYARRRHMPLGVSH
ncbi:DUF2784 domain-containing protein [Nocardia thailandica]